MDCHEPHPAPNEKMQPIQWTERPTSALVVVNSLWPILCYVVYVHPKKIRWEIEVTFLVNGFFLGNVCYFTNRRGGWEWENMFFPAINFLF